MKPPECNSMQQLRFLLVKIGEMEGGIKACKEHIRSIPKKMATELLTYRERLQAARYLYWFMPDIASPLIAEHLLGMKAVGSATATFLERIGPLTTELVCEQCSTPIICRSRSEFLELQQSKGKFVFRKDAGGSQVLCSACYELAWQEQTARRQAVRNERII
jgi:hypothetical protein